MESWYWKSWGQEWVNIMEHSVDHKNSATRQPGVSCSFVGRQLKDLTATTTSKSFWKGCTWTMKKYPKIALSALSALSHPSNHGWWRFQVELVPSTSASCNSPCALHCIRHLESVRQIYYTRIILLYIYTCKCICYIYIYVCVCVCDCILLIYTNATNALAFYLPRVSAMSNSPSQHKNFTSGGCHTTQPPWICPTGVPSCGVAMDSNPQLHGFKDR